MSTSPSSSSNNPFGLSGPELNWATNAGRGNYDPQESESAKQTRLSTDLMAAKARVNKLEQHVQQGHGGFTDADMPQPKLDPQYLAGGKFALSGPEQKWATGAAGKPSNQTFSQQLASKRNEVASLENQIKLSFN